MGSDRRRGLRQLLAEARGKTTAHDRCVGDHEMYGPLDETGVMRLLCRFCDLRPLAIQLAAYSPVTGEREELGRRSQIHQMQGTLTKQGRLTVECRHIHACHLMPIVLDLVRGDGEVIGWPRGARAVF